MAIGQKAHCWTFCQNHRSGSTLWTFYQNFRFCSTLWTFYQNFRFCSILWTFCQNHRLGSTHFPVHCDPFFQNNRALLTFGLNSAHVNIIYYKIPRSFMTEGESLISKRIELKLTVLSRLTRKICTRINKIVFWF